MLFNVIPGLRQVNMGSTLCATCVDLPDDAVKSGGVCLPNCHTAGRFWVIWLAKFTVLGLLLRWKAGYLDVAADGATIAHMTFFVQTLQLLGEFGHADLFGFRNLAFFRGLSGGGSDCGFALTLYWDFFVTVAIVPAFMLVFLTVLLQVLPLPASRSLRSLRCLISRVSILFSELIGPVVSADRTWKIEENSKFSPKQRPSL